MLPLKNPERAAVLRHFDSRKLLISNSKRKLFGCITILLKSLAGPVKPWVSPSHSTSFNLPLRYTVDVHHRETIPPQPSQPTQAPRTACATVLGNPSRMYPASPRSFPSVKRSDSKPKMMSSGTSWPLLMIALNCHDQKNQKSKFRGYRYHCNYRYQLLPISITTGIKYSRSRLVALSYNLSPVYLNHQ